MKNLQEDKLSMNLKVISTCEEFKTVWIKNIVFKTTYELFLSKVRAEELNRDIQIINITGVTSDKAIKRKAMSDKALFVANRLESYARVTQNAELLKNIHYTSSDFIRARDTNIVGICDLILSRANTHIANLADYNVTSALLSDLQTSIETYTSVITKPQTTMAQIKNATQNINKYSGEANELLVTRLDLDVEVFKATNPDFYSQYKTARIIISTGHQTTALSVIVNDKNQNPIPNVSATIINVSANKTIEVIKQISKKTGVKGLFRITNLIEGNYKITIRKIGYTENIQNFIVINGETTKLNLLLES